MANGTQRFQSEGLTGGAVGAGLVLVVLPCVALYFITKRGDEIPTMGLPILAIFGIMILFGTLALVSTLFARLGLSDPGEALALPEGSVRAAIALALIVLFAIISIMLYQSTAKPYVISVLGETNKSALVKEFLNRVIAVVPEACVRPVNASVPAGAPAGAVPAPAPAAAATALAGCPPENVRFSVHVIQPAGQESTDLAKQLLILIGTLMTSVTSFYFATRANEPKPPKPNPQPGVNPALAPNAQDGTGNGHAEAEGQVDGCDVAVTDATPDKDLPAAEGGVQK